MSKLEYMKLYFIIHGIKYSNDLIGESIDIIYELYRNGNLIHTKELTGACANYIGLFYRKNENYYDMLKYYHIAIEKGNNDALFNLGCYYKSQDKYKNMKKYFLMAIEKDVHDAMYGLGSYYEQIEKYDVMMKYYLMAIEKGNSMAMYSLGHYYENTRNYDDMIKYYLMATEKGNSIAMNSLGHYYGQINDYKNAMKYYLMANNEGYYGINELMKTLRIYDNRMANFILKMSRNIKQQKIKLLEINARIDKLNI